MLYFRGSQDDGFGGGRMSEIYRGRVRQWNSLLYNTREDWDLVCGRGE